MINTEQSRNTFELMVLPLKGAMNTARNGDRH